jgi:hypothetical protein
LSRRRSRCAYLVVQLAIFPCGGLHGKLEEFLFDLCVGDPQFNMRNIQ